MLGALVLAVGAVLVATTYADAHNQGARYIAGCVTVLVGAILLGLGLFRRRAPAATARSDHRPIPPAAARPASTVVPPRPSTSPPPRRASSVALVLTPAGGNTLASIDVGQLLSVGELVLGRGSDCDIVLQHDTISRRHAKMRLTDDGGLLVEDLGSANGTWHKGVRIGEANVGPGDALAFGTLAYRLETTAPGVEHPPAAKPPLANTSRSGWLLSGFDSSGQVVQIVFDPDIDASTGTPALTRWTIGRAFGQVDHVVSDPSISSRHACIRYAPSKGLQISDLGSANGTRLDARLIGGSFESLEGVRQIAFGDVILRLSRT